MASDSDFQQLPSQPPEPHHVRVSSWPVWLAIAITVVLAVGLTVNYRRSRAEAVQATKERLLATEFEPRRQTVERFFTLSYQTVRTIGLLPSVRGISTGNRQSDGEDVVESRRFPVEGDRTVQQLFNNLAANVSVSEVYLVMEGFAPEKGEVPFRMYDTVVVAPEARHVERADAEAHDLDEPEESEEAEYAYYPQQLAALRAKAPSLSGISTLDDLPAVASPVMRTCDNAQYTSKRAGDERDAQGLLYSAPLFDEKGNFNGLVSAVFRTNVLEALLLNVPRLVITDDDKAEAQRGKWAMPTRPSNFVLGNPRRGTWVGDRRDGEFASSARAFVEKASDEGLHQVTLDVRDESPWVLVYRFEPTAIAAAEHEALVRFLLQLGALAVLALAIILGPIGIFLKRARVLEVEGRIAEIANGEGDLTRRLDIRRTDEVGKLGRSFDALLERIHGLVLDIKQSAQGVEVGAQELARGNGSVSLLLQQQASNTQEVSATITDLTRSAKETSAEALQLSTRALDSSKLAEESGRLVDRSAEAMRGVMESSKRIAEIVTMVEEIAFQTNLLALNAGVEAARAGEHGKSFGVVAEEVRSLAFRTRKATVQIRALVAESETRVGELQEVIGTSGKSLATIGASVREISGRITGLATHSEQQAMQIATLTEAVARIDEAMQSNAATAEESSSVAESLKQQSDHLGSLVSQFKVRG
ncbi:MAG: methyl-accepting chemotaxis protein [Myxococcaceae bacterium]